ncbi:WecB/TagA/CpsF family glycosyltransferase [Exiguobacterium sp. s16]|uniref:WecB/TagA/CpsF family glycosyltransferase n=1 Tax=Exiguobacterium sp. s16 TaxID=2751237 RepID=UPI001BE5CAEA|nr:WecB/TagA/CpsF family glycosyltransferase [Exiguobacterium sp. s16]
MKNVKILNVFFTATDLKTLINHLKNEKIAYKYICVSNVHTTVMANRDSRYLTVQNSSYMNLTDGKPLQLLAKISEKKCERITGPEVMEALIKATEHTEKTHFFYGSTEDTLQKLIENLKHKYPDLKVAGCFSPPFKNLTTVEKNMHVEMINNLNPTYVWVGLGAPKQEQWMFENHNKINSLLVGVGAAFDYHAGKLKRAPIWMQNLSLEWLFRLLQEPKRLWKRYVIYNTIFLYYLVFSKR